MSPEIHGNGSLALDLVFEASVTGSLELAAGWALTAGALATRTLVLYRNAPHAVLPLTPMALLGVSRRL